MKVFELIEMLQDCDEDAEVKFVCPPDYNDYVADYYFETVNNTRHGVELTE